MYFEIEETHKFRVRSPRPGRSPEFDTEQEARDYIMRKVSGGKTAATRVPKGELTIKMRGPKDFTVSRQGRRGRPKQFTTRKAAQAYLNEHTA